MRNYIFTIAAAALLCACGQKNDGKLPADLVTNSQSANGEKPTDLPVITFENPDYEFGTVNEGDVVAYSFKFTNTGKSDLIISGAQPSCGCTVADYPHHPIKPGEGGQIDIKFDTNGKAGAPHKTITITSNCEPNITEISISGEVTAKGN